MNYIFNTRYIIPFLAILTALFCYMPMILNHQLIDLHDHEKSELFERIIVGATSCAFPLVLDVIMNFDLPKQFVISRWLFLASLVIPNVLMLATAHGNTFHVKFILCSNFCRQILVLGGLLNCLHCKQRILEICRNLFYTSACITMIIASNYHFYDEERHPTLYVLIFCFGSISYIGVSLFALAYLWQLFHQPSPFTSIERYCGVLALLLFVYHLVRICFLFPLMEYSTASSSHKLIVDATSAVFAFILPSRIAIENAALSNVLSLPFPFCHSLPRRFFYPQKRISSVMSGSLPFLPSLNQKTTHFQKYIVMKSGLR